MLLNKTKIKKKKGMKETSLTLLQENKHPLKYIDSIYPSTVANTEFLHNTKCVKNKFLTYKSLRKKKSLKKVKGVKNKYHTFHIYAILELFYFIQKYFLENLAIAVKSNSFNSNGRHGLYYQQIYSLLDSHTGLNLH